METIYLVASGDLRLSANRDGEAAQAEMEQQLVAAIEREGYTVKRPTRMIRSRSTASSTARSTAWRYSARFQKMRRSLWRRRCGSTPITSSPAYWSIAAPC